MQILLYLFTAGILTFIFLDIFLLFWIYRNRKDWAGAFAIWGQRNENGRNELLTAQQKLLSAINILKPIALIGVLLTAIIQVLFTL
jgi:hypothetical protein